MFYEPAETHYDLKFKLFGIPVRIHPMFWFLVLLLGMGGSDAKALVLWVVAVLISITVHELGHALALRLYGFYPRIVLYSFGGLTIHDRYTRVMRWFDNIFVSAAGPLAGFAFIAVVLGGLYYAGQTGVVPIAQSLGTAIDRDNLVFSFYMTIFFCQLTQINIFWGVFNLLPIFPLDGGQILREVCQRVSPTYGFTAMLRISIFAALLLAVYGATSGQFFLAIMFAWIAYSNYQMMQYQRRVF